MPSVSRQHVFVWGHKPFESRTFHRNHKNSCFGARRKSLRMHKGGLLFKIRSQKCQETAFALQGELLAQHQKCCQTHILPAVQNGLLAVRLATVENRKHRQTPVFILFSIAQILKIHLLPYTISFLQPVISCDFVLLH